MAARRPVKLVGIGNPERGDDAVGWVVARRLREAGLPGVEIAESAGDAAGLLALIEDAQRVILVDAAVFGAAPGTIRRFDAAGAPLPERFGKTSTHGLGLAQAIELARVLGRLPRDCVVYAIEGRGFEFGAALSPEVRRAAAALADRIRAELAG